MIPQLGFVVFTNGSRETIHLIALVANDVGE